MVIKGRRRRLGITRNERRKPNREWVPSVRPLLGIAPDAEIGRRVDVSKEIVAAARRELGISAPPKRSMATSSEVRTRLHRLSKRELGKALNTLDTTDAHIIKARYFQPRPLTLAQLGTLFGMGRRRIWQRERRAIVKILGGIEGTT